MIAEVKQGDATKAKYTWLADGMKAGVVGSDGRGFEYLGSLVYVRNGSNLTLESAAFDGGRIIASETSSGTFYTPNYFITDHLGSVRVVIGGSGEEMEHNDYHVFGLRWETPGSLISNNRYRYNGKEDQSSMSVPYIDHGSRMYISRLGRWPGMDRLVEKRPGESPY